MLGSTGENRPSSIVKPALQPPAWFGVERIDYTRPRYRPNPRRMLRPGKAVFKITLRNWGFSRAAPPRQISNMRRSTRAAPRNGSPAPSFCGHRSSQTCRGRPRRPSEIGFASRTDAHTLETRISPARPPTEKAAILRAIAQNLSENCRDVRSCDFGQMRRLRFRPRVDSRAELPGRYRMGAVA